MAAQRGPGLGTILKSFLKLILYSVLALLVLLIILSVVGKIINLVEEPIGVDQPAEITVAQSNGVTVDEPDAVDERSLIAKDSEFEVPKILYRVSGVASDDVLNIRSGPSASFEIIGEFDYNAQAVEVIGIDSDSRWVLVRFEDRTGWVHGAYLEPE